MTAVSREEARALLATGNVIAVGARGDEERRRRHGARTSFVRVLEVHADAVPEAWPAPASAGEVRLLGRPASIEAAAAAVRKAKAFAGTTPLTAFSLVDLPPLAGGSASGMKDAFAALKSAGLDAIAEAPLDAVDDLAAAVSAAHAAGLRVPRLTVHGTAGGPLAHERQLDLMEAARALQAAVGGIRAFAPLPRVSSVAHPSTGYDDVKTIAVARLLVDNIDSIQVDWALYGPKLAQVALTMGADDVDGISPLEGDLGRRRSPLEEIKGNIRAAGLQPVERTAWSD